GGTQYDLGAVLKAIRNANCDAHVVNLAGHGTKPEDLSDVRAEAWVDDAIQHYRRLVPLYDTIHVAGMCMGALVALLLCQAVGYAPPRACAGDHATGHTSGHLALLAAPIYIDGWSTPWYRHLRHLM